MKWNEYKHGAYQYLPVMDGEKVTEKLEVKTNPSVRDQDGFGSCYLFATTSLLDQECLKSGSCKEGEQISVLDILGKTQLKDNEDAGFLGLDGGNIRQVGNSLTKGKRSDLSFSSEKCAPYQQIEDYNGTSYRIGYKEHPQLMAINEIYREIKSNNEGEDYCKPCSEEFFKQYYPFNSEMIDNLSQAANEIATFNAFEEFLNEVLIPKKCQDDKNQIKVSGINFKEEHIPELPEFRKKMIELFKQDKSAAITSCTGQQYCKGDPELVYMSQCPVEQRARACNGHAYLLSGFRKICDTNGSCRNQYKVHNSWGTMFNVFSDDGWVEEGPLFDAYKQLGDEVVTYLEQRITSYN